MHSRIASRLLSRFVSSKQQSLIMPFGSRYVAQRKICNWKAGPNGIWTPKTDIIKPNYEVVIGGMAAALGVLDALDNHPFSAHQEIYFICGKDWIDHLLVDLYGDEKWGQCYKDMPNRCQNILKSKYPRIQPNDRLTLEQAKYLRETILLELESNSRVILIKDTITDISKNGEISFEKHSKINVPMDSSYFYNHGRTPNVVEFQSISSDGKLHSSRAEAHAVVYSRNKEDFLGKNTILFGTSVSSTWAYQHIEVNKQFTETVCLGEHGTMWQMVPANASIQVDKIPRLMLPPSARSLNITEQQFVQFQASKIQKILGVRVDGMSNDDMNLKYLQACHIEGYAVSFYDTNTGLFSVEGRRIGFQSTDVDNSQEFLRVNDIRPQDYMSAAGISACPQITQNIPYNRKTELNMTRRQFTSVRNVPQGSLCDSFSVYLSNTHNPPSNLRGIFPFVYDDSLEKKIVDGLAKYSISINKEDFFKYIRDEIYDLHHSPTEDELHDIWKSAFFRGHPDKKESDWEEFKVAFIQVIPTDKAKHARIEEFKYIVSEFALKMGLDFHGQSLFEKLEYKLMTLGYEPKVDELSTLFFDAYMEANPDSTDIDLQEFQQFITSTKYLDLIQNFSCHSDDDNYPSLS